MKRLPDRKTPAHMPPIALHNRMVIIYLTVCTDKHKPILAREHVHSLIVSSWKDAGTWLVGRYVIMPDHIHLFCVPGGRNCPSLTQWVKYWKTLASRSWPQPEEQPIWQKSFWDTQLRRSESYADKGEYVRYNPVRAGLCVKPGDWPWQGGIHALEWHD